MDNPKDLIKIIEKAKNILITSHIDPDFDAVGSSLGLYWILKSMAKEKVDIVIESQVPFDPKLLEGADRIQNRNLDENIEQYDMIFFLDGREVSRFTKYPLKFTGNQKVIHIDHHQNKLDVSTTFEYRDEKRSSTSELIYEIFEDEVDFSPPIAKALLMGIYDDTNSFTTSSTSKKTFEIAAKLIGKGANITAIAEYVNTYTPEILQAVKVVVNNLDYDDKHKYAFTYIPRDTYEMLNLDGIKMDIIVNLTQNILLGRAGYHWGFYARVKDAKSSKISFRSRENGKNVRQIAEKFGGGGHNLAAGAVVEAVDPVEAVGIVRRMIDQ